MNTAAVKKYIFDHWKDTVRTPDDVIRGNVRIPCNFTVPCAKEVFTDFYYWDTYFTNLGLMISGLWDQVKSNLDVMAFFVDLLGYVPNANHITDRSQPPLFTRAVFDLYKATGDRSVPEKYIGRLLREHDFFANKRTHDSGLSSYSTAMTDGELQGGAWIFGRVGEPAPADREGVIRLSKNLYSIAESGWDFNPRFNTREGRFRTDEFYHLDLNCLLLDEERKIAFLLRELGREDEAAVFDRFAEKRSRLIASVLFDKERGIYLDYNFKNGEFPEIISAASFYPYFAGVVNEAEDRKAGAAKLLKALELPHGLAACCERPGEAYLQWDYPAMWPSNVYFAVEALEACGLSEDAQRIARKYVETVTGCFEKTGSLWEKYDASTGGVSVTGEYETPQMLGWTAGVYLYLCEKPYLDL
ncbi:MAG: hypothetical protein IKX06_00825 [Clostridia bacterium]|nr:hypothetical protein [Clostridia bacterium]